MGVVGVGWECGVCGGSVMGLWWDCLVGVWWECGVCVCGWVWVGVVEVYGRSVMGVCVWVWWKCMVGV